MKQQKELYILSKINIMTLVSGGGTNLQALLEAEKNGKLGPGKLAVVISDRPKAHALERAKLQGIPIYVVEPDKRLKKEERRIEHSDHICSLARENGISMIVLAGYLSILEGKILKYYGGRIINLHPSLLPKYGGDGMYGERVHRAVLSAGEKESGCTVHIVDEGIDTGPIILQRKVPVLPGDTPDALADRIHAEEQIAIVDAVALMAERVQLEIAEKQEREKKQAEAEQREAERQKADLIQQKKEKRAEIELKAVEQSLFGGEEK